MAGPVSPERIHIVIVVCGGATDSEVTRTPSQFSLVLKYLLHFAFGDGWCCSFDLGVDVFDLGDTTLAKVAR